MTVLEVPSEQDSLFHFVRLTIRRFFRQTVKQLALGLVGILMIFGIGFGPLSVDEPAPLTHRFAAVQPPQSLQSAQLEIRHMTADFNPDVAQQLAHSRVTSSSLLGHRLTDAHLFTQPLGQVTENLTEDEAVVALVP